MNPVINTLQAHRSYRDFDKTHLINAVELDNILQAARQAPSWMNGQHYSIINIKDKALRAKIGALQPRNPQILSASVFLIFIADIYRMRLASQSYDGDFSAAGDLDNLILATTDTALAAQNALVAAESLNYGTCMIGGIRAIAPQLLELLELPRYTFPLFGLAIGKPSVDMRLKPRLPHAAVVFDNQYNTDLAPLLAQYETTMTEFGEAREKLAWREKFARYYEQPFAPQNEQLLHQQGFACSSVDTLPRLKPS